VPLEVLAARPDVRGAEADLRAAVAGIGVAEAELRPALELAGSIEVGASRAAGGPTTDLLVAALGALLEQVVADGGARDAAVAAARARAQAALAAYEQTLRDAVLEVEESLAALAASGARQASLEKAVAASARSVHQAEILYQQGLVSFLEVVDAQRVLAGAEQDLARARTRYATELARLFAALGDPGAGALPAPQAARSP
jgi:multidrug efflux system outer membrane protein